MQNETVRLSASTKDCNLTTSSEVIENVEKPMWHQVYWVKVEKLHYMIKTNHDLNGIPALDLLFEATTILSLVYDGRISDKGHFIQSVVKQVDFKMKVY